MTKIKVFLASPSDVISDKNSLFPVCDELNQTVGPCLGIEFEMLSAERNAQPGRGSDAQDVINKSIPLDYDVFIGIMGHKIGTQTPRAPSGTIEEYQRALEKSQKNSDLVEIFFYFKKEMEDLDSIDLSQLNQFRDFKERLKKDGIYYFQFSDQYELGRNVRIHLTRYALKSIKNTKFDELEEPRMTIDYQALISEMDSKFFEGADHLKIMWEALDKRSKSTSLIAKRMSSLVELPEQVRLLERMKLSDQAAQVFRNFSIEFKYEISAMTDAFTEGFRLFIALAYDPFYEDSEEGWKFIRDQFSQFYTAIERGYKLWVDLSNSEFPKASLALEWATEESNISFKNLLAALDNIKILLQEGIKLIDERLGSA